MTGVPVRINVQVCLAELQTTVKVFSSDKQVNVAVIPWFQRHLIMMLKLFSLCLSYRRLKLGLKHKILNVYEDTNGSTATVQQ